MSYKTKTQKSYRKSVKRKKGMYIIPFLVGIIVAVLIWTGWFVSQVEFDAEIGVDIDVTLIFSGLIIILLLVELFIAAIVIYFAYRNKIVKMRPKSAYKIENINEYLQARKKYQEGNYTFETIKSEDDIVKAYENGKKIVFTGNISGKKSLIWIGLVIVAIGLFIGIAILIFEVNIITKIIIFSIIFSIFSLFGAMFILPAFIELRKLPRSFFVLGREGVVYRRLWGDSRSYSWIELKEIYTVIPSMYSPRGWQIDLPYSLDIHIILPNGAALKFDPDNYHLDEILSRDKLKEELKNSELSRIQRNIVLNESRIKTFYLVGKVFKYYLDSGKKE